MSHSTLGHIVTLAIHRRPPPLTVPVSRAIWMRLTRWWEEVASTTGPKPYYGNRLAPGEADPGTVEREALQLSQGHLGIAPTEEVDEAGGGEDLDPGDLATPGESIYQLDQGDRSSQTTDEERGVGLVLEVIDVPFDKAAVAVVVVIAVLRRRSAAVGDLWLDRSVKLGAARPISPAILVGSMAIGQIGAYAGVIAKPAVQLVPHRRPGSIEDCAGIALIPA